MSDGEYGTAFLCLAKQIDPSIEQYISFSHTTKL